MEDRSIQKELSEAVQSAFEAVWKRASVSVELLHPTVKEEGIEYMAKLYDPFVGTSECNYLFTWEEIAGVIRDPEEAHSLNEEVSEWICDNADADGGGMLMIDDDDRVHFRRDFYGD